MARADGIQLDENHFEVLWFLKEYYDEYQLAPPVRILTKAIAKRLGKDKGSSRYLYRLFPQGPAKQACRYAGLPKTDQLHLRAGAGAPWCIIGRCLTAADERSRP